MDIKETNSVLVFRNVNEKEIPFFKDFPLKLWFLKGTFRDGIFAGEFYGTDWDISDYKAVDDDDDDVDVCFDLYFLKIE